MSSKPRSYLYLTLVNFGEALNEIAGFSKASTFTGQQLWARKGPVRTAPPSKQDTGASIWWPRILTLTQADPSSLEVASFQGQASSPWLLVDEILERNTHVQLSRSTEIRDSLLWKCHICNACFRDHQNPVSLPSLEGALSQN